MKKIKTLKDILSANNLSAELFELFTEDMSDDKKAETEIKLLAKAINPKKWDADFKKPIKKWFPFFVYDQKKACFVFDYSHCSSASTYAGCGPRLCFASQELSDFAGTQHIDRYNRLMKSY